MNIARLEHKLVVVSETVGVAVYDFDFDLNFQCEHPYMFEGEELCVLRIGPIADYSSEFEEKRAIGLRLVNTPDEHRRASELEYWYPHISDLTPHSQVYDELPPASAVEAEWNGGKNRGMGLQGLARGCSARITRPVTPLLRSVR